MRLYDITQYINSLKNAPDLMDIDPELIPDTIEALESTFEEKVQYSLMSANQFQAYADMCSQEMKRLENRRTELQNKANRIKNYIKQQMQMAGINKLDYPLFKTYLQNDPPKVVVQDEASIPAEWWREKVERSVDRAGILEHYKETKQAPTGITIEQGVSLRIK